MLETLGELANRALDAEVRLYRPKIETLHLRIRWASVYHGRLDKLEDYRVAFHLS